jgi:hypothetical protein
MYLTSLNMHMDTLACGYLLLAFLVIISFSSALANRDFCVSGINSLFLLCIREGYTHFRDTLTFHILGINWKSVGIHSPEY